MKGVALRLSWIVRSRNGDHNGKTSAQNSTTEVSFAQLLYVLVNARRQSRCSQNLRRLSCELQGLII